jgi:hypothetical protein
MPETALSRGCSVFRLFQHHGFKPLRSIGELGAAQNVAGLC